MAHTLLSTSPRGSATLRTTFSSMVVTSPEDIDRLIKDGKVAPGSSVHFTQSGVGVAVRPGAPRPDISTPEAFKKTLLAAKSVGISQGPSGL